MIYLAEKNSMKNFDKPSASTAEAPHKPLRLPWFIADDGYRPLPGSAVNLNIWPGPFNGDRIVNQLLISAPFEDITEDNQTINFKTIFLPEGLRYWSMKEGRHIFIEQQCPVDRCYYTDDVKDAESVDAVMFKWGLFIKNIT